MTRLRWLAALGAAAVMLAAAGGGARAQGLIGNWSADQACGTQGRQIVFRADTMELRDRNQRILVANVSFADSGSETAVTVTRLAPGSPPQPNLPNVGDIATFRRDGNRMFPVAVTQNGVRHNVPENVPPFYRCR